jgi:hypothetical protein
MGMFRILLNCAERRGQSPIRVLHCPAVVYLRYAYSCSLDLIESKLFADIEHHGETWFNTNVWGATLDKCIQMVLDDVVVNRYVPAAATLNVFPSPPSFKPSFNLQGLL